MKRWPPVCFNFEAPCRICAGLPITRVPGCLSEVVCEILCVDCLASTHSEKLAASALGSLTISSSSKVSIRKPVNSYLEVITS